MESQRTFESDPTHPHKNFADLRLGVESCAVRARLLRLWDSPTLRGSTEVTATTLLFLDEKGAMMNAFLPASIANKHRPTLREGKIYIVADFAVVKCPIMFKTADHPYLMRFSEETTFCPLEDNGPVIMLQQFKVRTYEQLHILANTDLELSDVVGVVKSVKGYGITEPDVVAPILISLLIAKNVEVDLVLLDDAAVVFKGLLNTIQTNETVVLITGLNPRKIGDKLYLLPSSATRFYYGPEVPAMAQFNTMLIGQTKTHACGLQGGNLISNTQLSSIGDLTMFLSSPSSQETLFSCKARVLAVISHKFWADAICTHCGVNLGKLLPTHNCGHCQATTATNVARSHVELLVDDGRNYANFLVSDKEILNLTKTTTTTLLANEVNGDTLHTLPPSLAQIRGSVYVFHVITTDNLMSQTCPFTVVGISDICEKENLHTVADKSITVDYAGSSSASYAAGEEASTVEEGGPTDSAQTEY